MYNSRHATRAYWEYFLAQGYDECQIMQPAGSNYEPDDGFTFVHRDGTGRIDFRVKFLDGDWNANVSFPNGESGDVCIFPDVSSSSTPTSMTPSTDAGKTPLVAAHPASDWAKLPDPIRLFYSYSHEDEKLRDQLERHLSILCA
jgi:hypothetical protein